MKHVLYLIRVHAARTIPYRIEDMQQILHFIKHMQPVYKPYKELPY